MAHRRIYREDDRPVHERMARTIEVWTYVFGLSVMMVAWALIAWGAIGSGTRLYPNYNLLHTTPAQQAYNTLREFQRPRR